jgi:hypothetical protein
VRPGRRRRSTRCAVLRDLPADAAADGHLISGARLA